MASDLELIKQLEKDIGRKLERKEIENIEKANQPGFTINENGNVIGLNLDGINLKSIPASILKFRHLKKLSLSESQLTDISFLQEMNSLIKLDLSENQILNYSFLQRLSNLTNLNLSSNQIKDISFLQGLSYLGELHLSFNQIEDISILQGLHHLNILSLRNNKLADISFLRGLNNLEILDLSHNNIKDISILQGLRKLNILRLENNKIIDISSLKGLSNLKILDLSSNHITNISSIEGLNSLNTLDLSNNKVKELSDAIVEMGLEIAQSRHDHTEGIFLSGNPLEIPPMEIIGKGRKAIKAFLNSLKTGEKLPLNEIKILLVGDGGVGKTSLVKRLLGQKFEKNEVKTHGININAWKIRKGANEIKVHLWDFGGQEIMHATHQFFLSKRSLYILVLDGRKDEKTEYWLKHIKSFGGDSPVLLTINKIDENPAFDVNRKFLKEKYENIKGFFRISCKTGEGIELFVLTLEKILPQVEILKSTWPFNWFKIKVQLENMTKNFISYKEYLGICTREKVIEKSCQDTLVDYLNDLGVILHFRDFELEDTYVLEPKWVTEAVYKIINSREVAERKGVLNLNMLDKILQKREEEDYYYPRDKYHYIIGLMKKFEICYGIDEETILIPDLLAVQEPSFDFDSASSLKFIIQYDFLPLSIMPRFIVNMNKEIKNHLQWRTGVVLEDKDFESTAVIKAHNEAKRIYIYVNGVQKRDYFAAILATLRRINRSFEKLKTTELIPMPDDQDITVSYKHLIRLEKEGIEFYLPGDSEKKYRVKDLLGSIRGEIEADETLQMLKQIQISQMQRKSGKKKQ